jgi:hypothetical protein
LLVVLLENSLKTWAPHQSDAPASASSVPLLWP